MVLHVFHVPSRVVLGKKLLPKSFVVHTVSDTLLDQVWDRLHLILGAFLGPKGYFGPVGGVRLRRKNLEPVLGCILRFLGD